MNKPKLIVPKHVWDGKQAEKKKKELEKIPEPTGFRIVLFPLRLEGKTKGGVLLTDDTCLLYTSPSPRDKRQSRMPSSA